MGQAWIGETAVPIEAAIAGAARLLAAARFPVIAGLGTDVAGARAAVGLAERIGGVIDHMNAGAVLRDLAVMREAGTFVTTPNEARLSADTLLLVGPDLHDTWAGFDERLLSAPLADRARRHRVWLCPGKQDRMRATIRSVGRNFRELPGLLAVLRAQVAGRPAEKKSMPVAAVADALKAARFGVAVWSARALDALAIEMLCGLVADLNATTRFSGLPLGPPDNAIGVLQACAWTSGFPPRTGFGRSFPEHDPWLFDAARLVDAGESDCALWISTYRQAKPAWTAAVPLIVLAAEAESEPSEHIHIQVGRPGRDHDAVEYDGDSGELVARAASHKSDLPSAAAIIARIAAALPNAGPWPC